MHTVMFLLLCFQLPWLFASCRVYDYVIVLVGVSLVLHLRNSSGSFLLLQMLYRLWAHCSDELTSHLHQYPLFCTSFASSSFSSPPIVLKRHTQPRPHTAALCTNFQPDPLKIA